MPQYSPVSLAVTIDTTGLKPILLNQPCKTIIHFLSVELRAAYPGIVPTRDGLRKTPRLFLAVKIEAVKQVTVAGQWRMSQSNLVLPPTVSIPGLSSMGLTYSIVKCWRKRPRLDACKKNSSVSPRDVTFFGIAFTTHIPLSLG